MILVENKKHEKGRETPIWCFHYPCQRGNQLPSYWKVVQISLKLLSCKVSCKCLWNRVEQLFTRYLKHETQKLCIIYLSSRLKLSICVFLLHGELPIHGDHLQLTFFHGIRACFFSFLPMVETFFSLLLKIEMPFTI